MGLQGGRSAWHDSGLLYSQFSTSWTDKLATYCLDPTAETTQMVKGFVIIQNQSFEVAVC